MQTADTVLREGMRKLWEDHIMYTRMFIVGSVAGMPDVPAVTNRLMKNQEDLGKYIAGGWGDNAVITLTELLKEHIKIAGDFVNVAIKGDNIKASEYERKWYSNGDMIVNFLTRLNPYWGQSLVLKDMFYKHLAFTTIEARNRISGDFAGDIYWYDMVHECALAMADLLSDGILTKK